MKPITKAILSSLLFLFTIQISVAQDYVSTSPSNEQKYKANWQEGSKELVAIVDFKAHIDGKTYVLKRKKFSIGPLSETTYFIEVLNEDLTFFTRWQIEINGEFNPNFLWLTRVEDKFIVFTESDDPIRKIARVFVQEISLTEKTYVGERKKILELDYRENKSKDTPIIIVGSTPDHSKLYAHYIFEGKKSSKEKFGFTILNSDLQVMWKRDIVLPIDDELFLINSHLIDNQGRAFFLIEKYKNTPDAEVNGKVNYELQLLKFEDSSEEPETINLDNKSYFTSRLELYSADSTVYCVGFYSTWGGNEGSYVVRYDPESNKVLYTSTQAFPFEFVTQGMEEKSKKTIQKDYEKGKRKNIAFPSKMRIRKVMFTKQGEIIVFCEYKDYDYYWKTEESGDFKEQSKIEYYTYGKIAIYKLSTSKELEWYNIIPKWQETKNDRGFYSGFFAFESSNSVHILYNDLAVNTNIEALKDIQTFTAKYKKSVAMLVSIGKSSGIVNKEALYHAKHDDVNVLLVPSSFGLKQGDSYLIYGYYYKLQRYGLLSPIR